MAVSDDFKRKLQDNLYPLRSKFLQKESSRQQEFQKEIQSRQKESNEE